MENAVVKNRWLREANGACGDLGTFLPYVISAVTVGGLSAVGVFFGFGVALISAGLFYGLPMAVQPMKAIAAALLTSGLTPSEIALAGTLVGALFLLLGLTGGIGWLARNIPRSITLGLVLGLGLAMMWLGLGFMLDAPWLGFGALAFVVLAAFVTRLPLLAIGVVVVLGVSWWSGDASLPAAGLVLPEWVDTSVRDERIAPNGRLLPAWQALFEAHPERFVVAVDTFSTNRWHQYGEVATDIRHWLTALSPALQERLLWRNAEALFAPWLARQ